MTIDITIGRVTFLSLREVLCNKLNEDYNINYKVNLRFTDFIDVEQCPDEPDGCSIEDTYCPNSAYRSGNIINLTNFFEEVMPELIKKIRPMRSNDEQITLIKPYLAEINDLKYKSDNLVKQRRLKWFKFWCNRAVELYGEDAAIKFT